MSQRQAAIATLLLILFLAGACGTPAPAATPVQPTGTVVAAAPTLTPMPNSTVAPLSATPVPQADTGVPLAETAVPPTATVTLTPLQPPVDAILAGLRELSLDQFLDESYKQLVLRSPEGLTYAGVSELFGLRDDRLNDLSDAFIRDTQRLEDGILEILRTYDRDSLTPEQQVSYDVYEWYLDSRARGHPLMYCEYSVHYFLGSYDVELVRLFTEIQPVASREDAEDYVARLSQVGTQVGQVLEGLRLREEAGAIPPRFIIELTLPNLRAIADSPARSTPFYTAFADRLADVKELGAADKRTFLAAAEAEIRRSVIPALQSLVDYFERLETVATDDAGLWRLPNGQECYEYLLRRETSTDMTPEEIHALGLSEVARIQDELRQAFDALGYPKDASLGELMNRAIQEGGTIDTRTQAGRDRAVAAFEEMLAAVSERLPQAVDLSPRGKTAVVGDLNGGGYYVPGSRDGSRPGAFHAYVGGASVARFRMATTAYHEAIPGHGFQTTIAMELDLPVFRTDLFFNGYSEGWALYAERLAWELGMYDDDPYGNIGRLQLELLRAVRLVTDTGIHAMRWTREEAKAYMTEALGDPSGGWSSEVDRYVVLPGQATGYKIGQLKILALRQRAMDALGDRFDLVEFHRVVLGNGALPLEILERLVDDYIASQ